MLTETEARRYIEDLVAAYPRIREVWLYGSHANGTARDDSDWDYLAFADDATLQALWEHPRFRHPDIDLMIVVEDVYEGKIFIQPWLAAGGQKRGTLADEPGGLRWRLLSPTIAEYESTRQDPSAPGGVRVASGLRAVRVYRRFGSHVART
jgi:hypothetical protein